jgi:hypothetical protein
MVVSWSMQELSMKYLQIYKLPTDRNIHDCHGKMVRWGKNQCKKNNYYIKCLESVR